MSIGYRLGLFVKYANQANQSRQAGHTGSTYTPGTNTPTISTPTSPVGTGATQASTPTSIPNRYYTVQPGDTLSGIAQQHNIPRWRKLYNSNRDVIGPNPNRIRPGTRLSIPVSPNPVPSKVQAPPPPANPVIQQVSAATQPNHQNYTATTSPANINPTQTIQNTQLELDPTPFMEYVRPNEGSRAQVYRDGSGHPTIGVGHLITDRSRGIFQELFGDSVNYDDIVAGKASLTPEQINNLFRYDVNTRLTRQIPKVFPKFNTYPEYLQQALFDSHYRGDTGRKTTQLINQGKWSEAAKEYLNRRDYREALQGGPNPGIVPRMNRNRDAMLRYAEELEKQNVK